MTRSLWRRLKGYVIVKIKGKRSERFLNDLIATGITPWRAEKPAPGMLITSMSISSFKRLRSLKRARRWSISIVQKKGLPFTIRKLMRRKAFLVGAAFTLITLYIASGFVWFIEVNTDGATLEEDRILSVAAREGLTVGVRRDEIDHDRIRQSLLIEIDEVSWAAVNVRGVVATIEATERAGVPLSSRLPGDVIATRDGVITHVAVTSGTALVVPGDIVRQGDVLISGFVGRLRPTQDDTGAVEVSGPYVRASGVITARTWYEGSAMVTVADAIDTPTGHKASGWTFRLGSYEWTIGHDKAPYDTFRQEKGDWSALRGTLQLERVSFEEVTRVYETISRSEAVRRGREAAMSALIASLEEDNQIFPSDEKDVAFTVEEVERVGLPALLVTARLEVNQSISAFSAYDDIMWW